MGFKEGLKEGSDRVQGRTERGDQAGVVVCLGEGRREVG